MAIPFQFQFQLKACFFYYRNIQEEFEQRFHKESKQEWPERSHPFGAPGLHDEHQTPGEFSEKDFFKDVEEIFNNFFGGLNLGFQPHDQGTILNTNNLFRYTL